MPTKNQEEVKHTRELWVVTQGAHTYVGKEFAVWVEGHEGDGDKLIASWIKNEDHARLIAASPDLLRACKAMLGVDNPPAGEVGHVDFNTAVQMAREAIKKAEVQ